MKKKKCEKADEGVKKSEKFSVLFDIRPHLFILIL